jgi:hypothetical protein
MSQTIVARVWTRRSRAARLTSRRERQRLARELDGLIAAARDRSRPRGAQVPVNRAEVIACTELIHELADDLRGDATLQPPGIAMLRRLLRDGGSPLYGPAEHSLESTLIHARDALLPY